MVIAIDGPAASGKGTLARRLAAHFGLPHLDTGLLYRATARALIAAGRRLDVAEEAAAAAASLVAVDLDEQGLRGAEMGDAASVVAAIPEVRTALIDFQRRFAAHPGGAVLDGRDIGTAICPQADVKIYVTAAPEERARRRMREHQARGEAADFASTLAGIRTRDERDSGRAMAPLQRAPDAVLLDTTGLSIDQAFEAAVALVEARSARA